MTFVPNYFSSKMWEKVGINKCAQLPVNKKSTPGPSLPQDQLQELIKAF
jgi:hypothetical protein